MENRQYFKQTVSQVEDFNKNSLESCEIKVVVFNCTHDKAVTQNKKVFRIDDNIYINAHAEHGGTYLVYVAYTTDTNHKTPVGIIYDEVYKDSKISDIVNDVHSESYDTLDGHIKKIKQEIQEKKGFGFNIVRMEFLRLVCPEIVEAAYQTRTAWERKIAEDKVNYEEKQKAQRKAQAERDNEYARNAIEDAVCVIQKGGKIVNKWITVWGSDCKKSYTVISFLVEKYGIKLPIRTKGWIENNLSSVEVNAYGSISEVCAYGSSKKFYDCMRTLISAVRQEIT